MTRFQKYFNGIADKFSASSAISQTVGHRPDIGSNREDIVRDFLNRHLPKRTTAYIGGKVIGVNGSESKQIDVLVANDIGVRFDENDKTFFTTESIAAALTVKSNLNSAELEDCLLNLASLPDPDREAIEFRLLLSGAYDAYMEIYPLLFVFAYEGMDPDTSLQAVKDFYNAHPEIPKRKYVDTIIVNKEYMISYHRVPRPTVDGTLIPENSFWLSRLDSNLRGYPFVQLLNEISQYADWLNQMTITIGRYFRRSYHPDLP